MRAGPEDVGAWLLTAGSHADCPPVWSDDHHRLAWTGLRVRCEGGAQLLPHCNSEARLAAQSSRRSS